MRAEQMRYYVYVSDTKLDMLYPQIPAKLAARLAWELKLELLASRR